MRFARLQEQGADRLLFVSAGAEMNLLGQRAADATIRLEPNCPGCLSRLTGAGRFSACSPCSTGMQPSWTRRTGCSTGFALPLAVLHPVLPMLNHQERREHAVLPSP